MANGLNKVKPGQVITAESYNAVIDKIDNFEQRLSILEVSGPPSGGPAAIGYIEVRYVSSARGINLVPSDAIPYPHTFTVVNNTNRSLTIQLDGSIIAPHGNWVNSVKIQNTQGIPISNVTLESGASRDIIIAVTTPVDAVVGEQASLNVTATVGGPHNKQGPAQLNLTVAQQSGPPVVRDVKFVQIQTPSVDTNNVTPSAILTYAFDLRYSAVQPPPNANFTFSVTLTATPASTLSDWFVDFSGATRNNPSAGVFTTPVNLADSASDATRVTVRVRAPVQKDPQQDKFVALVIRTDSTDLAPPISVQAGSFTIRLPHA